MNTFRFFWTTHKWTGICLASVFVVTAVTGFLLLFKKRADWIQPPTQTGVAAPLEDWISIDAAWSKIEALGHADFKSIDDVGRIDVRIKQRVYKVHSKHNNTEVQLAARDGAVLSVATRRSDWLEDLHDGSFIGAPFRDYVMPVVALGLLFLVFSGIWLWMEPIVKRRRRKRARNARSGSNTGPLT